MKLPILALLASLVAAPALAAGFQAEAGVSYFAFRGAQFERNAMPPLQSDEPDRAASFVALSHAFNPRFALRLSYHFLDNVHATLEHGSPPGSLLPIVVWGHYRDDVHVVGLAPEFNFALSPRLSLALAPKLNWVASRGVVSYSTTNPTILLIGPQARTEDGFTAGGSARLSWSLGPRVSLTAGYEYADLDPSFDREAHVLSGGVAWRF